MKKGVAVLCIKDFVPHNRPIHRGGQWQSKFTWVLYLSTLFEYLYFTGVLFFWKRVTLTSLYLKDKYRTLFPPLHLYQGPIVESRCSSFFLCAHFQIHWTLFFFKNLACDLPELSCVAKSYSISKPAFFRIALNGHLVDFLSKSGKLRIILPSKLI